MGTALLKLTGITKGFPGVRALQGVDIKVDQKEILALVGANGAGKSTLMNVLGGVFGPDSGKIEIDGHSVTLRNPRDAKAAGIAFVHQEMALLPTLSIVDNMFISGFPRNRTGSIDYRKACKRCSELLNRLGCTLDPATKVKRLGAGDRQMVEIARALLDDPRIIIFDEATSSLSSVEAGRLFSVIRALRDSGSAIVYITHFLDEIFGLCDRAVVLRNGKVAGESSVAELTSGKLVSFMLGRNEADLQTYKKEAGQIEAGPVALRAKGISRSGVLDDITLELRSGEIVGLWGLLGSGRTELARILAGLDPCDGGTLEIREGDSLRKIPSAKLKKTVGLITENRKEDGLLSQASVRVNISLASLPSFTSRYWPFIREKKEKAAVQSHINELDIKTPGMEEKAACLSGGNQQKVILGRWLEKKPPVLIMDEPTRGLDIGAKLEMQARIGLLARSGTAVMVISSEIEEIMAVSHRFMVIDRGRMVAEFGPDATKEELLHASVGAVKGGTN